MNKEINILYLDDEINNLETFKATFRRDYKIFTANNAKEAFEIIKNIEIHIAIVDQRMPDLSGVQFFEDIMPNHPRIIRMLLTGYIDLDSVIEAINTGRIFRYIKKPWEKDELKLIIDGAAKLYFVEEENQSLINSLQENLLIQHQMIDLLKNYIPENIMNEIVAGKTNSISMEGEKRIVTVLFVEIFNFASLIQNMSSKEGLALLNDFFSMMSDCIVRNKGFLNTLLGGGVMAIFGAPVSYIDNAANAIMCGFEMIQQLQKVSVKHKLQIDIAVGIHSGEGIVGNAGSKSKLFYTVYGSVPKLASQLVNLGKKFPNKLIISESTLDLARIFLDKNNTPPIIEAIDSFSIKCYRASQS